MTRTHTSGKNHPFHFTSVMLALCMMLVSTVLYAQPTRFPGLVFRLINMETNIDEMRETLAEPSDTKELAATDTPAETAEMPAPDSTDTESIIRPLLEAVQNMDETVGPYDNERKDVLTRLAMAYQEIDAHDEALGVLNEVLQIHRIQDGLNSITQIPVVDALRDSEAALKNLEQVDNMEALALHIVSQRYPEGSDVLTRRMVRKANWNIEYYLLKHLYLEQSNSYRRYGNSTISDSSLDDSPFNIRMGASFTFGSSGSAVTPARSTDKFSQYSYLLSDSEEMLVNAITDNTLSDDEKITILRQLAAIHWYRRTELYRLYYDYQDLKEDFLYLDSATADNLETQFYRRGLTYLEGALEIILSLPESTLADKARAMLDLADWHLAFYRRGSAREQYAETYTMLIDEGLSEEEINDLMNPTQLIKIPTYVIHQYSLPWWQFDQKGNGLAEVSVWLRNSGRLASIGIEEMSDESESYYVQSMLRSHLQDSVFRPKIVNGELVEQKDLQLLFEYSY